MFIRPDTRDRFRRDMDARRRRWMDRQQDEVRVAVFVSLAPSEDTGERAPRCLGSFLRPRGAGGSSPGVPLVTGA